MIRGRWGFLAILIAVLAVLGAAYAGMAFGLWRAVIATTERPSAKNGIGPGFIGIVDFGRWKLLCMRGPASSFPAAAGKASDVKTGNACRLNQEVSAEGRPERVIVAANLSLVGSLKKPALMLRLPGTFHAGDIIVLNLGTETLDTAVRDCSADECVAASALSNTEWNHLVAAKTIQIMFPMAGGHSAFVDLPVDGLTEAAAALDVAEDIPPR